MSIPPESLARAIAATIREVPDFPQPGIVFKDITPVLADPRLFTRAVLAMAEPWRGSGVTRVAGIESRGFILGAPVALALEVPFVPLRKPGKLPWRTAREEYALEYGADALEAHVDGVRAGDRVLIVDDVLATGGTASAACRLVERLGASAVGVGVLVELGLLGGRERLASRRTDAVVVL